MKKFFGIFFASLLCILPYTGKCYANKSKKRVAVTFGSKDKIVIRLVKDKTLAEQVKKITEHLNKGYAVKIIDGGSYGKTARANGFECHHLVSAGFCRNHKNELNTLHSPSVLIPKEVHRLTGSHPKNGRTNMKNYHQKEENTYAIRNSIHDVVKLGIKDLICAFKKYNAIARSSDIVMQTPVKNALRQTQAISPNRTPLEVEEFLTPKNAKPKKRTISSRRTSAIKLTPLKASKRKQLSNKKAAKKASKNKQRNEANN